MAARIATGEMEGYLAYAGDEVVGWMNAQPYTQAAPCVRAHAHSVAAAAGRRRTRPRRSFASSSRPPIADKGHRAALLAAGLDNLAARGVALVDAFPWKAGPEDTKAADHYHGSLSMFVAAGFEPIATHDNLTVVRKTLTLSDARDTTARSCRTRSRLLYALAIVFASLQPFSPWIAPAPDTPFWPFAPWPLRWTRFDVIANLITYVPLGMFVALVPRRATPRARTALGVRERAHAVVRAGDAADVHCRRATPISSTSSPTRSARWSAGSPAHRSCAPNGRGTRCRPPRNRIFLPGSARRLRARAARGVAGGADQSRHPAVRGHVRRRAGPARGRHARRRAGHRGDADRSRPSQRFQLLGVGLFLALLVRERRFIGGAVLLLVGAALLVKGAAAVLVLKPAVWEDVAASRASRSAWRRALLVLFFVVFLPRPVQVATCAVALLASLLPAAGRRRSAARARAAHAVQLALRPPAHFQRPDAIGAAACGRSPRRHGCSRCRPAGVGRAAMRGRAHLTSDGYNREPR